MANTKTRAVTVRIPNDVLDALDAEADALGESRSSVFSKRLRRTLSRAEQSSKTDANRSIADEDTYLPEEAE